MNYIEVLLILGSSGWGSLGCGGCFAWGFDGMGAVASHGGFAPTAPTTPSWARGCVAPATSHRAHAEQGQRGGLALTERGGLAPTERGGLAPTERGGLAPTATQPMRSKTIEGAGVPTAEHL